MRSYLLAAAMSVTALTASAAPPAAPSTPEDPYVWMEEIEGEYLDLLR